MSNNPKKCFEYVLKSGSETNSNVQLDMLKMEDFLFRFMSIK